LVGTLQEHELFSEAAKKNLAAQPDHPVNVVVQMISQSEAQRRSVKEINRVIRSLAANDPQIIIVDNQNFFELLATPLGTGVGGSRYTAYELFPDGIHLNDNGHAFYFNMALKPALEKIPGLSKNLPKMPSRNLYQRSVQNLARLTPLGLVATDFALLAVKSQVKPAQKFLHKEDGDYWAVLTSEGQKALENDSVQVFETSQRQAYAADLESLQKIEASVKASSWLSASGFVVSRKGAAPRESLTLNLSQIIFYTAITLDETAPGSGVFEGYGYDFWSSIDRANPPRVNYHFVAVVDPNDPARIDFTWKIYPLIRDSSANVIQDRPLVRLGYLDSESKKTLALDGDQIPHITFYFSARVD
jgi:hypothetical protein